jgi:hypothetical protein
MENEFSIGVEALTAANGEINLGQFSEGWTAF